MQSITSETHPYVIHAMRLVEEDNGGHLIGTVYPGDPIDMTRMDVPDGFMEKAHEAEGALKRFVEEQGRGIGDLTEMGQPFYTFVIGGENGEEDTLAIISVNPYLQVASDFINLWFNAWEP